MYFFSLLKFTVLIYKFCSRGLFWLPLYGAVFGMNVIPLGNLWGALIGGAISLLLIFLLPMLGIFTPILFLVMLITAIIVGFVGGDIFRGLLASVFLAIHLFRTFMSAYLARKYPLQTRIMDNEYQSK